MKLYASYSVSWADCVQFFLFFRLYFWSYVQLKCENFLKTLLFEFLSFSKTRLFCSFIIFKRTKGISIESNYINFTKTTNKLIVSNITRPFEN